MSALDDDMSDLARAIVRGEETSPQMAANYPHYAVDVAIEVYRNNYRGNLHDALAGAYPVIAKLVGKDFFRLLARQYIGRYPSRSGNLHHYGAEMAEFVAAFEPAQGLPYLPDVAVLEWACHRAWFADDAAIDIAGLAQISPEQYSDLILCIHPACHLVCSRYPVAAIWQAHQPGENSDFHIDLDSGPCNVLVSRKDDVVRVGELAQADAAWLQAILAGIPLGGATAATLERHPDFDLQAALMNLAAQDALSNFELRTIP
ncbi:MAG TPA: DNA-binding domain-containing protein [Gallionella sp.]|nr:DNA-binding domain-containing protein [Gallionella sp.]